VFISKLNVCHFDYIDPFVFLPFLFPFFFFCFLFKNKRVQDLRGTQEETKKVRSYISYLPLDAYTHPKIHRWKEGSENDGALISMQ
jgi:hypothetical protein